LPIVFCKDKVKELIKIMLEIKNLKINFNTKKGIVNALKGIDLFVDENEIVGVLGESGAGKSVLSHSIMRLLQMKNVKISGNISFKEKNIYSMNKQELQNLRGKQISMVFQDPFHALDPLFTIKDQMIETAIEYFSLKTKQEIEELIKQSLLKVKLRNVEDVILKYPHELSGGMLQRVLIALALLGNPELIIADEPTSALDVKVQIEIVKLLKEIQEQTNISVLFITHNIELIKQIADRIIVMQNGNIVEQGSLEQVLEKPQNDYTKKLIEAGRIFGD
jgi:oligopeptide transport system ATP-binding protein